MKPLVWVGILLLALGIASFFFTLPKKERQGVQVGGASIGIETTTRKQIPTWASAALIVGGILVIVVGSRKV